MAATPCVLTAADSTSAAGIKKEIRLHQPYLSFTPDTDGELVKPRRSEPKLHPYLTEAKTSHKSKNSLLLDSINMSPHAGANAVTAHEKYVTSSPEHFFMSKEVDYRLSTHDQHSKVTMSSGNFHSLHEKHSRVKSVSPPHHQSYTIHAHHRRRFESVPSQDALYGRRESSSSYLEHARQTSFDNLDMRFKDKCPPGCQCMSSEKDIAIDLKSRSHSKARLKYTPVRDDASYEYSNKSFPHEEPRRNDVTHRQPLSPDYWSKRMFLENNEKSGYHPIRSDMGNTARNYIQSATPYDQRREDGLLLHKSVAEDNEKRSSAFSVIRPAAVHRVYSNESGYASDPTNTSFVRDDRNHHRFYHHKYSRVSQSESKSPTIRHKPYEDHVRKHFEHQECYMTDNKLHVYDDDSKAALKAFDAHVEKMMAESRDRKLTDLKMNGYTVRSESQVREMMSGEITGQLCVKGEPRYGYAPPTISSSSSLQPLVQVSTVDSTQGLETKPGVGGLLGLTMVANEHLGQAIAKEKRRSKNNNCLHLWQFLRSMLDQEKDKPNKCIEWTNRDRGEFRLIKTAVIADLWGQSKNRSCMTYEKMARAMRYYYKMKILEKVPHKRLHFRFGEKMLAKVLDTSTIKPLRHMSSSKDKSGASNGVLLQEMNLLSTREPQVYHGGLGTVTREAYLPHPTIHANKPLTSPTDKSPLAAHIGDVSSRLQATPVICSTAVANETLPIENEAKGLMSSSSCYDNDTQRSSDSDDGETPVSSPTSESDGELIVDMNDD